MRSLPGRYNALVALLTILSVAGLAALGFLLLPGAISFEAEHFFANLGFFALFHALLLLLMVLIFLVAKNVAKLILDRRRRILGAGLRTRLVIAFVLLALVPTVLMFSVSKVIVSSVMQQWFSPHIADAIDGALAVAKKNYENMESSVARSGRLIALSVSKRITPQLSPGSFQEAFQTALEEYGLSEVLLLDSQGRAVVAVQERDLSQHEGFLSPGLDERSLEEARSGESVVRAEQAEAGEVLRAYSPVPGSDGYVVVASAWMGGELHQLMTSVMDSYDDYKELRSYRRLVASSYLLTLIVVAFLVLVAAIWVGFYLARSLTVPIQQLAEGTQAVARGNLEHRIPEIGDDELAILVRSFNTMTEDLSRKTGELEARRRYMETVLARVGVGVLSVDAGFLLTTFNLAAAELFGVQNPSSVLGQPLGAVVPKPFAGRVKEMLLGAERQTSGNLAIMIRGESKQLRVSANPIRNESGEDLGAVVLVDDLTELVSAQRMSAWQEVARRIAHEIKNPLTPIQLSAQRMLRRFAERDSAGAIDASHRTLVSECSEVIVKQVEVLRNLVNEFSRFARMPRAKPELTDLNSLLLETVKIFRDNNADIAFELNLEGLPRVPLDKEQMGRVFFNILDNAVASIRLRNGDVAEYQNTEGHEEPAALNIGKVELTTAINPSLGIISISFKDDGTGVSDQDKLRIFEPYFSTKKGGTGLGLAIVNSIVADHNGFLRIRDNEPRGAIIVVELPAESGRVAARDLA